MSEWFVDPLEPTAVRCKETGVPVALVVGPNAEARAVVIAKAPKMRTLLETILYLAETGSGCGDLSAELLGDIKNTLTTREGQAE